MDTTKIKRFRPAALMLFAVAVAAFAVSQFLGNRDLFMVTALLAFGSIGFFIFTEAFLFSPPERTNVAIWLARIFFALTALVVLGISVQFGGDRHMGQFILVWLLGGILTVVIWKWTRRKNRTLGLVIGSFAAALTFTPSIVVGHGYVFVPAILVFLAMPARTWLYYAWLPIFVTWLMILGIAFLIRVLRSRQTKSHEDAA